MSTLCGNRRGLIPAGHAKCLWWVGLTLSPLSQGPPGCSSIQLKPLLLGCRREEDLRASAWGGEGRGGEGYSTPLSADL